MPRAHVVKAEERADAMRSVKCSGFNDLVPQTIVLDRNPKINPLCPRHRDGELRMRDNSIFFFCLRPHHLQPKIRIVVNIAAARLLKDHQITGAFTTRRLARRVIKQIEGLLPQNRKAHSQL
jgi:hypothetical protein